MATFEPPDHEVAGASCVLVGKAKTGMARRFVLCKVIQQAGKSL